MRYLSFTRSPMLPRAKWSRRIVPGRLRGSRWLIPCTAVACLFGGTLRAQTVHGAVVDDATGRVVLTASVLMLDKEGRIAAGAVTDQNGNFVVAASQGGEFRLRVDATGFTPMLTDPFTLASGERLDVQLRVSAAPLELDPVEVKGEAEPPRPGRLYGFDRRRRRPWGAFVTREEIEARGSIDVSNVLRTIPGVRLVPRGGRGYDARMVRAAFRFGGLVFQSSGSLLSGAEDASPLSGAGRRPTLADQTTEACRVVWYLDGVKTDLFYAHPNGVDAIDLSDVEGIEVYRGPSETPAEFLDSDSRCGVIAVWTRR